MRFAPHTDDEVREMLAACGLDSLDDLFAHVPEELRVDGELDLPEGMSEMELIGGAPTAGRRATATPTT